MHYPYSPSDAKSNLDSTFGKWEMEQAAIIIIKEAQKIGGWNVRILFCSYSSHNTIYGMELLAGYGWLIFLADEERWTVTPEFIKRVCQNEEDRDLHNTIQNE